MFGTALCRAGITDVQISIRRLAAGELHPRAANHTDDDRRAAAPGMRAVEFIEDVIASLVQHPFHNREELSVVSLERGSPHVFV